LFRSPYILKREILEVGKRIYDRGYIASNDGNISARLEDGRILITPTGISKGFMKEEDLILVDSEGKILSGNKQPSSEMQMHLYIYKNRPDVNSVCHAHPPYATGFAVAGIPLDKKILPESIITFGSIPLVEYGTPGGEKLYLPLLKYLNNYDAFLLANHGAVTVGSDVLSTYHKMETVEHTAHITFIAQQLGNVNELDKDEIAKLILQREKFSIRKNVGNEQVTTQPVSTSINSSKPEIDNSTKELIIKISEDILKQIRK